MTRAAITKDVPGRCATRRGASGFTLIELLVVIVVIAILAGILVPALMRAKSAARKVECLARLKQWSLATHLFLEENEGFLPREGILPTGDVFLNNWAQVKHADARDVWYNAVAPYMNVPKAADYFLPNACLNDSKPTLDPVFGARAWSSSHMATRSLPMNPLSLEKAYSRQRPSSVGITMRAMRCCANGSAAALRAGIADGIILTV